MSIMTTMSKKVIRATGFRPSQLIIGSFVSAGLEEWVMKPAIQRITRSCNDAKKSKHTDDKKHNKRRHNEHRNHTNTVKELEAENKKLKEEVNTETRVIRRHVTANKPETEEVTENT